MGGSGVFLALFSQSIAASIEMYLFGVNPESENTQRIMEIITALPLMVFVSSVFGPILEEIIFRKIIFGAIYEKTNFFHCRFVQFGALLGRPFGFQPSAHLYSNGIHILLFICQNQPDYRAYFRPCRHEYARRLTADIPGAY